MSRDSDHDLVRRFQRGDLDAFASFVARHQDRICRLARALLVTPSHAPDAAQEVFLRAYTGLPRFEFRSSPFRWLYQTLRNVCREFDRRDWREVDTAHDVEPRSEGDLSGALDVERRLDRLLRLVGTLPRGQRDVLLLRVFEGMSVEETARALGRRPGTIKAQLHRALTRIRAADPSALAPVDPQEID